MSNIVNIKAGIGSPANVIDGLIENKFDYESIMVIYTTKDKRISCVASGEDFLKMIGSLDAVKMHLWEVSEE